jgi:hypothetical protein
MNDIEAQVYRAIAIAKEKRSLPLSATIEARLESKADAFSRHVADKSILNVVIFHINIPKEDSVISSIDIKQIDHHSFEYETMIMLNIRVALWSNPNANVFLITDEHFLKGYSHERLTIIRSVINAKEPMYERVMAMNAYIRSTLFSAPTIFLDSDAFLISNPQSLFQLDFDIGLTHRDIKPQMAINEGVIYAHHRNKARTQQFFDVYLSIYAALDVDDELSKIYQNIRRWRGGQLSINGAAGGSIVYSTGILNDSLGYTKAFLPCSRYNLSLQQYSPQNSALHDNCLVLHFKGSRKLWIDNFAESLMRLGFC